MKHFILFIAAILSCLTGFAQGGYDPSGPGDPNPYRKLSVLASPKSGGSANSHNGSQIAVGQTVTCYANANGYYDFVHWLQNGEIVSDNSYFTFAMPDEDVEMTAVFELNYNPESPDDPQEAKPSHRVTITSVPGIGGYFNSQAFRLCEGDSINVYAYPNNGYHFEEWLLDGILVSTKNPLNIKMTDKDLNYTARFSYNPVNPGDPAINMFNPTTGEMVIDRFNPGYLSSAIYDLLGNSYDYSQITSLVISGIMDVSDFGFAYNLSDCAVIDLSRTNGYTEIPSYAFESSTALTEIILPSCINSIGRYVFNSCKNLSVITCLAVMPPSLSYGAFAGVDNSGIIRVPAQSLDLYKNASGWNDFTILTADSDMYSLTVSLPSDAGDGRYRNMSIELLNTSNGQSYRYLITDKTEYIFDNLLSSTEYSVSVKNNKNEILGEISSLKIVDKDISAQFQSLRQPKNIAVKVMTPDENDITSEVTIKWFNYANELLQQGPTLSRVLENSVISYSITLPLHLQKIYLQPSSQTITILEQSVLTHTLDELGTGILKGKVCDADGKGISTAIITISQNINGAYTGSEIAQCDDDGNYEIEVTNVPIKVSISANGYIGQTKDLQTPTDIGHIVLEKNTGITVYPSYTFQASTTTDQETSDWFNDNNVAYLIEDLDGNEILDCIYQSGSIILPIGIKIGDKINVVVYSKNNLFNRVTQTVSINSKSVYANLNIVGYGGISITTTDDSAATGICILYDMAGIQIGKSRFRGNSISFENLPDGQYTVISMQKSTLLGSVSNLSSFQETQLVRGSDYLLDNVNVVTGQITNINITDIPDLDETKLYYTDSKETYFMPNKSQLTIGNYVTLKAKLTIKDEYAEAINAATLVVDIPSNCELVDNSIISGAGYLGYEYADNRLSVPIKNLSDAIRFCVIPVEGGNCKSSAFVKLVIDNNEILQPIGTVYFEANNFSLSVPQKTSKTNIAIRGTATADSEVKIYDNDILVGTTYSMPNGQWSLNLSLYKPYSKSIHNLYGEVVTQDGKRLLTQSKTVDYDQGYVDLSKVTMVYNNSIIVFDHLNGRNTANSYSYAPGTTDFTFIADFTENNPEKISNVIIKILASDGSVRSLPADYNATSGNWVVRTKYADSNKLPVNVTANYQLNTKTSMFDIDRYNDDMLNFNGYLETTISSLANGTSEIISDSDKKREIAIIPHGENSTEYITIEQIDYHQLKAEFEILSKISLEDENRSFCYRDTIINNVYTFYYLDNKNLEAYALIYSGNKKQTLDNRHRILPIIISASWGVVSAGIERWLYQGQIDFWRRSFDCDKNRIQQNHTALINALYAECEDGSLKIKEPFNFQIDEEFVDKWADNSVNFLAAYKHRIDLLEQYYTNKFCAQSLFGVGTSLFSGGLGKFIPEVSPLVNNGATAALETFGQALGIGVDKFFTGNLKPENALSNWFETESRKLTDQYVEVFGYIKADYSDCDDDDDDNDDNDDDDDDGGDDENNDFPAPPITPSIDPSGYVYEAVPSNRIAGVTATAYFKQQSEDMYGDITETAVIWDAAPFGQENPLTTDAQGMYAWDVPAGMWQVRLEKDGYEPAQSEWLPVPPPQLDVNIAMTQVKQPEIKNVHAYSDGMVIEFDKFMLPSTMTVGNITVTQNGQIVDGEVVASDIELDINGNAFCSKVEYKPSMPFADGEATLFVSKVVKSYASVDMGKDFMQTFPIEPRISEIRAISNIDVPCGSSSSVTASIVPATAAQGKSVLIESLNPMLADVSLNRVEADLDGNITFDISGLIIGNTGVRLSVEDCDIETIINVNVSSPVRVNQVATPSASVESGEIQPGTEIYLSCDTESASIYYTTDGSCPCDVNRLHYDGTPVIATQDFTLKIIAEADGMVDSEIAEYTYILGASGIEDIQLNNDLSMFPLPLGEYLNISNGDYTIDSVSIYNLGGNLMLRTNKPEKHVSLKVGFLPSGVYLIDIQTNNRAIVKKVLKR